MNKTKLTKIIKKRRLNYKPTIGIILKDGTKVSVNAVEYYNMVRAEEKAKVEKELHERLHQLMRQVMPGIALIEDMCAAAGAWGYYF